MNALRVLFLTTGYPSDIDILPGIFHRTTAVALSCQGVDVEVVAPVPWSPKILGHLSHKYQVYHDIPEHYVADGGVLVQRPRYVQIPRMSNWMNLHGQFADAAIRITERQPDIIHAHYGYPCGLAAALLSKKWSVPTVLTLHGSDVNVYPNTGKLQRERFIEAVKAQNSVIAVSNAIADATRKITGVHPIVLPIGKDLTLFQLLPDKSLARKQLALPYDPFIVLFIGNLINPKGIRELLRVLEILENENVIGIFCGVGPLENNVRKRSNAQYCGLIPADKIPTYLAASDAMVLPTYREGMPTVLIEAGAAGTPVIASHVGGIPELLCGDRGILIAPQSIDDIVLAIRQIINNPQATFERAKRLMDYVCIEYDVNTCVRKLIDIYEYCLAHFNQSNTPAGKVNE